VKVVAKTYPVKNCLGKIMGKSYAYQKYVVKKLSFDNYTAKSL